MNADRDSGPQASHFVGPQATRFAPHGAARKHAPAADLPAPLVDADAPYPWPVRLAIMLVGGGALWAGVIWAGWRWLR